MLTDVHRTALAQAFEDGPMPATHGMVRWRVIDLVQWLSDTFEVSMSKQTLNRELRQMGDAAQGSDCAAGGTAGEEIAASRPGRATTPRRPVPIENVWQFIRGNWLSDRVLASYNAIVDRCCDAWNRLTEQPWRVMSIGLRGWVPGHRPCVPA